MGSGCIQCRRTATPKKTPKRIGGGAITPGLSELDDIFSNGLVYQLMR
jgi:hypothetical protein